MNIFVVSMSARLGGIEKSMIPFLKFLCALPEANVDLMLWKCDGELLKYIPSEVNIVKSPTPGNLNSILKSGHIGRLFRYISLKWHTLKGIPWKSFPRPKKQYDIAVAYSQDGYSPYYVIDCIVAKKKYLWYHHGAYVHKGKEQVMDIKYYPLFTNVIAVSESIRDILIDKIPSCKANIKVINNLIDQDNALKLANESGDYFPKSNYGCKILTVGRLSHEKGQLRAIDIAYELKKKGFSYLWIFVGDGADFDLCKQKVVKYGLQDLCMFIGAKENPYPYYKEADICVVPSYVEADPITIQEALIFNKLIISADIPSIRAVLQKSGRGLLANFDLHKSVAEAIMSLYRHAPECVSKITGFTRNVEVREELNSLFYE